MTAPVKKYGMSRYGYGMIEMENGGFYRASDYDALAAAISTPEAVFVNMKRGTIAKPSLRSMIDLYGEVVNGEEAQLLEIARLRAKVAELELDAGHYRRLRNVPEELLGNAGVPCVAVPWGPTSGNYVSGADLDRVMAAKAEKVKK